MVHKATTTEAINRRRGVSQDDTEVLIGRLSPGDPVKPTASEAL
jgi:hypothetical protein